MEGDDAEFEREMALLGLGGPPKVSITSTPIIKSTELERLRKIGSGQYGDVYEGKCRGQRVAIKYLRDFDPCQAMSFQAEVEIMSQNRNPHVVLCLGACIDNADQMAMVTEFCDNGDLEKLIHSPRKLTLSKKLRFAIEICAGMSWLTGEEVKTLHKDLKPANILIDSNWNIKISDFGISSFESKGIVTGQTLAAGSPIYMSPEALQNQPTTYKSDVYAFGILMWEIFSRKTPFEGYCDINEFKNAILNLTLRPNSHPDVPEALYKLCQTCWEASPEKRPSFQQLINELHAFRLNHFLPTTLCPLAGKLWSENFLEKSKVSLAEFFNAATTVCGIKSEECTLYMQCVTDIYSKQAKTISLPKLSKLLKWFGPLDNGTSKSYMFAHFLTIMRQKWFFGLITAQQAENLLSLSPPGTFLVRLNSGENSSISDAPFTVSTIIKHGQPGHIRVLTSKFGGLWCKFPELKIPSQADIVALVQKLQDTSCVGQVCGGYPFEHHRAIIYMPSIDEEEEG